MIDPKLLNYRYDEEVEGFGEPQTPEAEHEESVSWQARLALASVGVGLIALVVQWASGWGAGTWLGFLAAFGLPAVGGSVYFWLAQRDQIPGIKNDGVFFRGLLSAGALGWLAGIVMTGFYVLLYWYPEVLGHSSTEPTGLVLLVDPLARLMTGYPASQWFLYGVLYTLAIGVFGVRMAMKYRHNRYQLLRTASVFFFQFALAWLLPNILVWLRKPYMEFNGVWPLKHDYLWPEKVGAFQSAGFLGWFLLFWAVALVIATPILTYYFGKRWYCSWVCGCGGLAETLGDPWRQLSSKSTTSWRLERWIIHGVLATVLLATAFIWADHQWQLASGWSGKVREWYGFYIGALFSGVVGVGFYPLLGSRVWCRFGCPQAAILGILQRCFSRFRITTNGGQCMSCGNCSTYCEMGIDVRAYAQRGENIVRASCVGCGVCSAVCPRGVLRLENGPDGEVRLSDGESPLDGVKLPNIYGYRAWESKATPAPNGADSSPTRA